MNRCYLSDERLTREKFTPGRRRLLDSQLRGFHVVITSRSKTFVVRTSRLYRVIGRWPLVTSIEARQQAHEILRLELIGEGFQVMAPRVRIPTLREAFEKYLSAKSLKPKSIHTYREVMTGYATDLLDLPLSSISTDLYTEAFGRINARSQANLHAALVGAIYNYMDAIAGLKLPNPATSMRRILGLHKMAPRTRLIGDDQQRAWYGAVQELESLTASDLFIALALTGTRRNELRLLSWSMVEVDQKLIRVPDTKSGRPLVLPLGRRLLSLLSRRKQSNGDASRVFPIGEDMVYHYAKKVILASTVPFSPHDLRRGFATLASKLLGDELVVKALLNHAPIGVTQKHYVVRCVDELREPIQRIEDYLFALWEG